MTQDPLHSWGAHIRATLRVGLPLVGGQLAMIGLGVTDTVMLGWLGAEPLAASVLGTSLLFICLIGGSGFAHAVTPTVAAAAGVEDGQTVRRAVRMGLWLVILYAGVMMPILWQAEALLLIMGQDPALAREAAGYVRIAQWGMVMNLFYFVMREFLSGLERTRAVLGAMLAGLLLNFLLDYALIFGNWGFPAMGIRGAAVATVCVQALVASVLVGYALRLRETSEYRLFQRFWRGDGEMLLRLFKLGWPISLTMLSEVSLFAFAALMMGWLGTIPLAAHGIAIQLASIAFMIPLGLSFAATVRVGRADGRRDGPNLRRAGWAAMVVALVLALVTAAVLLLLPGPMARLFLDLDNPQSGAVLAYAVPLLLVAALFQVADTSQAIGAACCRGIKDTRVPMLLAILSYLLCGLPMAYGLGFGLGYGGVGVWFGLAGGLFVAGVVLNWRFWALSRRRHLT